MKEVRPTSGKVLLALFSILGNLCNLCKPGKLGDPGNLKNVAFLDLFAGTGRVGVEALRRGAARVVMVEVSKERARKIERAVPAEFAGAEKALVLSLELRRAIAWLVKRDNTFDVIFADPPYDEGWGAELLYTKNLEKTLKREGILIVEHASRETLDVPSLWSVKDVRVYGETTLTFLISTHNPGGISS